MYIPKNRIKPNLYTPGNELVYKWNSENYVGFYHSLWTGKYFTGKNQNVSPKLELIIVAADTDGIWNRTSEEVEFQQYAKNYDGEVVPGQIQKMEDINEYNFITKTDIAQTQMVPQQYYPKPTEEDYALGVFTRYFCVKINELVYLELSKEVYDKFKKKDIEWTWEMYTIFKIQWTLTGNRDDIIISNRNQSLIAQQRIKRIGFTGFLKKNWLKYNKSS